MNVCNNDSVLDTVVERHWHVSSVIERHWHVSSVIERHWHVSSVIERHWHASVIERHWHASSVIERHWHPQSGLSGWLGLFWKGTALFKEIWRVNSTYQRWKGLSQEGRLSAVWEQYKSILKPGVIVRRMTYPTHCWRLEYFDWILLICWLFH